MAEREVSPGTGDYAVAVVNYRAYSDLRRCVESVKRQSRPPRRVFVVDVDSDPSQLGGLRGSFPDVEWDPCPNRGFGAGANRVVSRILSSHPEVPFLLLLNPDVELDAEYAEALLGSMREYPDVALASGKLLRPDGRTIDSAGIVMGRNRHPRDRGSETPDRGLYEQTERVFGVSGAAMMIRLKAAGELALDGELFDEDFFAYCEDTDLAWRASRFGWSALYVPQARARHQRGWRRDRRMSVPRLIRQHSFKNHYLQIIKNEESRDFFINLPILAAWEVLRLGYAILRDPAVLPAYVLALRLAPRAWAKRQDIRERARRRPAHRPPKTSGGGLRDL